MDHDEISETGRRSVCLFSSVLVAEFPAMETDDQNTKTESSVPPPTQPECKIPEADREVGCWPGRPSYTLNRLALEWSV
jgi:hypothetical protein